MPLKHAILGFLSIQPMSGYDLKKAFNETVAHFWTADQAQIYRTLTRLIEDGLVQANHIEQEGRPDRKEHSLTAAGREELDRWLVLSEHPQSTREPFLIRVFFVGRLGSLQARELLTQRIDAAEEQLAVFNGIAAALEQTLGGKTLDLDQQLRIATLDNGISHLRAEIDWAQTLLDQIQKENHK